MTSAGQYTTHYRRFSSTVKFELRPTDSVHTAPAAELHNFAYADWWAELTNDYIVTKIKPNCKFKQNTLDVQVGLRVNSKRMKVQP